MSKILARLKELESPIFKSKEKTILVEDLKVHPNSARKIFNPEKTRELSSSIKIHGIIEPIQIDKDNYIIKGNRCVEAVKYLGNKELKILEVDNSVDVIKYSNNIDATFIQILSDIHTVKLTIYELAEAFKKIIDNKIGGIDNPYQLSKYLGVTPQYVYRILTILEASSETIQLVRKGVLTERMVVEVLYCLARNKRYLESAIINYIILHKLNVVKAQRLVSEINHRDKAFNHILIELKCFKGVLKSITNKFEFYSLTSQQKKDITAEVNEIDILKHKLLSTLVRQ